MFFYGITSTLSNCKTQPSGCQGTMPETFSCSDAKTAPKGGRAFWSGWRDLNARPQRPERCALAKLSHIPLQNVLYARP